MRKNLGNKPLIYPQPVLIIGTYDKDGNVDAMNAAWGGVGDDHEVFMCLSTGHKTVKNFLERKAFTVQIGTENLVVQSDFVGIVSANNTADKFKKSGLKAEKSEFVDAPVLTDYPISLECELTSYDPSNGHCFGKIVNASVDESILTDGKVDVSKLKPIAFGIDRADYIVCDKVIAKAFEVGKSLK